MSDLTILDTILNNIKEDDVDVKIIELCEKIQKEEDEKYPPKYPQFFPDHPNIFLALEVTSQIKNQLNYITLERELPGKYIVCLWMKKLNEENKPTMKVNSWSIKEETPKKIIIEFAKIYKIYK